MVNVPVFPNSLAIHSVNTVWPGFVYRILITAKNWSLYTYIFSLFILFGKIEWLFHQDIQHVKLRFIWLLIFFMEWKERCFPFLGLTLFTFLLPMMVSRAIPVSQILFSHNRRSNSHFPSNPSKTVFRHEKLQPIKSNMQGTQLRKFNIWSGRHRAWVK